MKENENLVILPEDKGKSLTIMYLKDYKLKINEVFSDPTKFKKLESDPLEENLIKCRTAVNSLKKYVAKKTFAN